MYELLYDLSAAPEKDKEELSVYYNNKLKKFLTIMDEKQHQVSKKDEAILLEHINQLNEVVDQFKEQEL